MSLPALLIADTDAARTLFAWLADETVEVADAAYLDPEWRLCGRWQSTGTLDSATVSIRALVARAIDANAASVLLAHNHPSGDPEPSREDIAFTRRLAATLGAIDMPLIDHLIVTRDRITSLRARGLL